MSRTIGFLLAWFAPLLIAAAARPALAQDPPGAEDLDGRHDEVVIDPNGFGGLQLDANFDLWSFGGPPAVVVRKKLELALGMDINRFDRKYGLTPVQKKKLELAGRHDIQRFFDRIDDARAEYQRSKGDWNQVGELVRELQRIQNQPHSKLFGDESMLAKTLKKNLTPEQIAGYDKKVYRDRVDCAVALLDRRIRLEADQHRRLVELMVEESPPLKRYGSFDYDAILYQMSRLDPRKLRSVLGETTCRDLSLRFEQARRMEGILVSEGYIAAGRPYPGAAAGGPTWHHQEARR